MTLKIPKTPRTDDDDRTLLGCFVIVAAICGLIGLGFVALLFAVAWRIFTG